MQEGVGVTKEIDALGRIVIPKEYRARFSLQGRVELILTPQGILLRSPLYELTKKADSTP